VKTFGIREEIVKDKYVRQLLNASVANNKKRVESIASTILNRNFK
jgi:hypothetical protein